MIDAEAWRKHLSCRSWLFIAAFVSSLVGCHHVSLTPPEKKDASGDEAPSITVTAKPAEFRNIGRTISLLGRCDTPPEKRALITSVVEAQLTSLLAKQGDRLNSGASYRAARYSTRQRQI